MPRGEFNFVEWARTLIGVVGCCGLPIGSVWSMRLSDLPIVLKHRRSMPDKAYVGT